MNRVNIRAILGDPVKRRRLFTAVIETTQAREGIETTPQQAAEAYDKVLLEQNSFDSNEVIHARSIRIHGIMDDLQSRSITLDEAKAFVDEEAKNANLKPEFQDVFDGFKKLMQIMCDKREIQKR